MSAVVPSLVPPSPPASDVLVLAVDSAPASLDGLEALLAAPGVHVLRASAGREALELLRRHDVALAIVDAQTSDMSGLELTALMRGTGSTRAVPIIVLTATPPEPGQVIHGSEAGGVDVLVKPVDPQLLRRKVGVFIELWRQRVLLSSQLEQLEALRRTSELLIGALGHDLRSPLNAITMAVETLLLARPDDEMATLIGERIRAASHRMSRQISQILDFAGLRFGSWGIDARDADLAELCRIAAREFEELNKRGFDCVVQGDPRGHWDPDRLLQVFSSLIGNALQLGAIDQAIAVRIDGRGPDVVVIDVEHGGTLPESVRDNLFTPFAATRETRGGAGLGLYIIDQIARAHGGGVDAGARDERTVFTVRLPRRASES